MSTKSGIVQQESACSRLALLRPWKVKSKADGYWTDGAEDTLSVTQRGRMRVPLLLYQDEALEGKSVVDLVRRGLAVPQPRSR